jgi:receptor-binding and translocation channel-forming TcA subunit of Tc toxin
VEGDRSGQNDSGMFETYLRDERFLPFEGAGAESTWRLELPKDYPAFDFATISDVVLHLRYTARRGVDPTAVKAALDALLQAASSPNLALVFSLRHDFPDEWHRFVNGAEPFRAIVKRDYFPYFAQSRPITISGAQVFAIRDTELAGPETSHLARVTLTTSIPEYELSLVPSPSRRSVLVRDKRPRCSWWSSIP